MRTEACSLPVGAVTCVCVGRHSGGDSEARAGVEGEKGTQHLKDGSDQLAGEPAPACRERKGCLCVCKWDDGLRWYRACVCVCVGRGVPFSSER